MTRAPASKVIRDPLWNNIRIDPAALAIVDSAPVQRLRYVRQLGHAFLVYPGATHNRFEHALGTYHLSRRATALLSERGLLSGLDPADVALVHYAALLHDVGHYPFSHALEEAGLPSHEQLAAEHLRHPELASALAATGIPSAAERIVQLISGTSSSPLQGLISGSVDLDKIEYLRRDAHMCGVPYGAVDVDRLLDSLLLAPATPGGRLRIGVHQRGMSALESLLFSKYQMYRNIYWHHAVRSATAMFKRLVRTAIACGQLDPAWIAHSTDEELMERLRTPEWGIARRLRQRRLYKRALELPSSAEPASCDWIPGDPDRAAGLEDRLAREVGLEQGELLVDYPIKPAMLDVDLPVMLSSGRIGVPHLDLQQVADALHATARRLRVFVAEPRTIDPALLFRMVE
jgi:HD superfamily phosphohydrolase